MNEDEREKPVAPPLPPPFPFPLHLSTKDESLCPPLSHVHCFICVHLSCTNGKRIHLPPRDDAAR
jgi:hypothetical protein